MKGKLRLTISTMMWAILLLAAYAVAAHAQTKAANFQPAKKDNAAQPAGAASAVTGSGTAGQLTRWYGASGSSYTLGDSIITEDKLGKIGIGTTAPSSKLTVQGMVETTLGGYKFPDGTVQTTAAVSGLASISHDATLTGNGTAASPLGINVTTDGLTLSGKGTAAAPLKVAFPFSGEYDGFGFGVHVVALQANAIFGISQDFVGIGGTSINGAGASGFSFYGNGVEAFSNQGIAVHAYGSLAAPAGKFEGNVQVVGSFSASGQKNFKIDHPLDPENKYLVHASIESSEVKNLYDGVVALDQNGEAIVKLPDWFDALNKDFRYALTALGAPGPGLYVAEEIANNHFKIAGGTPFARVSWQVTGVRNDAYMIKHPMQVEVDKEKSERGFYLHPELFNQPEEKGIEWARQPEQMRRIKAMREQQPAAQNR